MTNSLLFVLSYAFIRRLFFSFRIQIVKKKYAICKYQKNREIETQRQEEKQCIIIILNKI